MDRRELRRQRKQDQVRQEILDAARKVLVERGLGGLTLAAVARELQLSKAALYHYFASKELLVFELVFRDLEAHAVAIESAVRKTTSGADAIAALIHAATDHYSARMDELRLAYMVPQVAAKGMQPFKAPELARIRPLNELMYGSVDDKIRADQDAGLIDAGIDGRRLAFLAHTSVLGMLSVEGMVAVADDAPLRHGHQEMVEELVCTFRARLQPSQLAPAAT